MTLVMMMRVGALALMMSMLLVSLMIVTMAGCRLNKQDK